MKMSHAIVLTLSAAGKKVQIVEAYISDVPGSIKQAEIIDNLRNSRFQEMLTEHGVFMANRRVVAAGRIPEDAVTENAASIEWNSIANAGSVQFNMRVPASDRARYERAARAAGVSITEWARNTLREASINA